MKTRIVIAVTALTLILLLVSSATRTLSQGASGGDPNDIHFGVGYVTAADISSVGANGGLHP
jgi:hypothetical protein